MMRLTFSRGPETVYLALIRTPSEVCVLLKHHSDGHLKLATAPNLIEAVLHQQDQERDLMACGWSLSGVSGARQWPSSVFDARASIAPDRDRSVVRQP